MKFALFLFLIPIHAVADIVLAPGESQTLTVPAHGSLLLTNGKVAKLRESGRTVMVLGKTPGESQLRAGPTVWNIKVIDRSAFATYQALEKSLQGMLGLELIVQEQHVLITGELLRARDWIDLKEAVGVHATYQFAAKLSSNIRQEMEQKISQALLRARLTMPALQFEPQVKLLIPEASQSQLADYQRVMHPFGIRVEVARQIIEVEPMIRVQILVAEVQRSEALRIGIRWPSSSDAVLLPPPAELTLNQNWLLEALETKGLGRILASPKLLCRSGKTAEFLAGGEFPIKIITMKTHDVIWKKHGVSLKIQPRVDLSGNMSLGLETEVSILDTREVDGVPGLLTNRIQTHVDLKRSQTIALSGLIKQEWHRGHDGLPGLSRIPVLGALFGSQDFRENRTELVVFVTPEVVSEQNATQPMPQEFEHVH